MRILPGWRYSEHAPVATMACRVGFGMRVMAAAPRRVRCTGDRDPRKVRRDWPRDRNASSWRAPRRLPRREDPRRRGLAKKSWRRAEAAHLDVNRTRDKRILAVPIGDRRKLHFAGVHRPNHDNRIIRRHDFKRGVQNETQIRQGLRAVPAERGGLRGVASAA